MSDPGVARQRRLAEELEESGLVVEGAHALRALLLEEVDHVVRPDVHERRVVSSGTILEPRSDPATWEPGTQLEILRGSADQQPLLDARRFADGLSSWLLRRTDGTTEWMVFNRPAGSERDLVVLASVFDATIVQRHPAGAVRVVGSFGVLRWDGFSWHREPPVKSWIDAVTTALTHGDTAVIEDMLEFAVHDLGSLRIGALLIYRPDGDPGPAVEERLPTPPPLRIRTPTHLAPLRHALAQVDGAAVFDADGVLRQLGVRLVPSNQAEETVEPLRGTRHTSARRYSHDDPLATVIAVSDDGPVSVFRNGAILANSHGD
jgi:Probable sensor domain DACNK/DisA bacterial checkpoint controller nucleotide-binding